MVVRVAWWNGSLNYEHLHGEVSNLIENVIQCGDIFLFSEII
jgi:hypothetical protein